jgi:riboflavin biosynthesis pyrimidine reductase
MSANLTKPLVICHMLGSLDGGLHPSRWLVGRITMAEMSKAAAHPPAHVGKVDRPYHFAAGSGGSYAISIDPSGKLHFAKADIGGDHAVVVLGREVPDQHLAELAADGVSYIVAGETQPDLAGVLDVLGRELKIRRLLLEGGAAINGAFLAAGLVDEISLLIAPALDGRMKTQHFVEIEGNGLPDTVELSLTSCEKQEHGLVHLRLAVRRRSQQETRA